MLVKLSKDPLKMFDDIWEGTQLPATSAFKVDISEDEGAFHLEAEMPGLKKEDITLGVEEDVLTIKGERKQEKQENEEQGKNYHRVERVYGSFSRSFNLGELIDQKNIEASFENGVLHVNLPKAQQVKTTKEIAIK